MKKFTRIFYGKASPGSWQKISPYLIETYYIHKLTTIKFLCCSRHFDVIVGKIRSCPAKPGHVVSKSQPDYCMCMTPVESVSPT